VHIDTKKLGKIAGIGQRITGRRSGMVNRHRGIGWEYLQRHRLPRAGLAWFARHGVTVERIMTDNGNAYRGHDFRDAWVRAGVWHLRTRPYPPRTNGKAERFLQTVMRECAYAHPFQSSRARAAALPRWLHLYNVHRPHTALHGKPPISRLTMNTCLGTTASTTAGGLLKRACRYFRPAFRKPSR
jgi:hypothetical protein